MSTGSVDVYLIYLDGEGKVNEEGVQYYNNLIDYMVKQGNDSNTKNQSSNILQ
jgi:beta-glucosidase/6-phospho-beta-glucosidase/beta-galactosidase